MSYAYRQTISDDMLAAIEARRGLLSIQEFTTVALAQMIERPDELDHLRRRIDELQTQLAQQHTRPPLAPAERPAVEMLAF